MNAKFAAATVALLLAGSCAQGAMAGIVLQDNFDSDSAVLNWPGDSVFQSLPQPGDVSGLPSVDLVSTGDGFGSLAYGTGVSVDLDGTTGYGNSPIAGEIQSLTSLLPGNYTVSFLLAGNLRTSFEQTTVVSIGSKSFDITPSSYLQPYTAYALHFTGVSGPVTFTEEGPSDQQGNLLDNVVVTTGVPEPATWAMMLVGFGGLGAVMRSRRTLAVTAA